MFLIPFLVALARLIHYSQAKAVYAHFMLDNAQNYSIDTWAEDIALAKQAHMQAFALNFAYNPGIDRNDTLSDAFEAAYEANFTMFFSFDYGPSEWPKADVINLLEQYATCQSCSPRYTQYKGKPLVSTFEGADNADDWIDIKNSTACAGDKCFFIPSWSSVGAKKALGLGKGVADGLFNWGSWPTAPDALNTTTDEDYISNLAGKPYMMAVSPYFYTNLPAYKKNWLWQSDWLARWDQVLELEPEFVEVVTWNDYGESHYIGPLRDDALSALDYGGAPFNYAKGMPHDGWRATLPLSIDLYLSNHSYIISETLSVWFRPNPASADGCSDGGTTANTASQGQTPMAPKDVLEDRIYFDVMAATTPKNLSVTIGGQEIAADWTGKGHSAEGIGLWHGNSTLITGQKGEIVVTVITDVSTMMVNYTDGITPCTNGLTNFNYWTGYVNGSLTRDPATGNSVIGVPS